MLETAHNNIQYKIKTSQNRTIVLLVVLLVFIIVLIIHFIRVRVIEEI